MSPKEGMRPCGICWWAASREHLTRYSIASSDWDCCAGVYESTDATPVAFGIVTTDRGDVRELTDASGNPFAFYSYDAYGNPAAKLSTATSLIGADVAAAICSGNVVRYAGYVYDQESGLYYLSARYYDPSTASFLTKDPANADGEESPYQYCGGDPVGKVDPSGEAFARFDGKRFRMWRWLGGKKYKLVIDVRAITSPGNYKKPNGALPPGTYEIYYNEWQHVTQSYPGNWGPYRARLHAYKGTNIFGRNGLFFHSYDSKAYSFSNPPSPYNGRKYGWGPTHGCLRVDPSSMDLVHKELARDSNKQMPIYVKY